MSNHGDSGADRRERSARQLPEGTGTNPSPSDANVPHAPMNLARGTKPSTGRGSGHSIARIATWQSGAVTQAQLMQAGLGEHSGSGAAPIVVSFIGSIEGSTFSDTRRSLHHARESAALLAGGERAVISHSSAAVLWGFAPP